MAQEVAIKSDKPTSLLPLIILTVLSIVLWSDPSVSMFLAPVKIFVTTLHELGHAIACLATGGTVNGLTIVSDNDGHGGLTMCVGGNPFIYSQTGYLGTAFFGCLFIFLGRFRGLAKPVLILMGIFIGVADVLFMSGTIFREGRIIEGVLSMSWGLVLALGLIWSGWKLPERWANLILLFLAVQTALNALTDVGSLLRYSATLLPAQTWTDATNMEQLTHVPASLWSLFWAASSIVMLGGTLWLCYGAKRRRAVP